MLVGCTASSHDTINSRTKIGWSKVTRVVIIKDREKQTSWDLSSQDDVATICELFQNMKYGDERVGGSAGSFLRLQFFDEKSHLGEIILVSPDNMQYADDSRMVVLPIVEGAWTESQWDVFLGQL